jgi:hypothetical protein
MANGDEEDGRFSIGANGLKPGCYDLGIKARDEDPASLNYSLSGEKLEKLAGLSCSDLEKEIKSMTPGWASALVFERGGAYWEDLSMAIAKAHEAKRFQTKMKWLAEDAAGEMRG